MWKMGSHWVGREWCRLDRWGHWAVSIAESGAFTCKRSWGVQVRWVHFTATSQFKSFLKGRHQNSKNKNKNIKWRERAVNAGADRESCSVVASKPRRGWKTLERVTRLLFYSGNLISESVSIRNFTSHYKEPEQVVCNGKVLHFKSRRSISVLKQEGAKRFFLLSELRGYFGR